MVLGLLMYCANWACQRKGWLYLFCRSMYAELGQSLLLRCFFLILWLNNQVFKKQVVWGISGLILLLSRLVY